MIVEGYSSQKYQFPYSHLTAMRELLPLGHDLQHEGQEEDNREIIPQQLGLPGFEIPTMKKTRKRGKKYTKQNRTNQPDDLLLSRYLELLAAQGVARKGFKAYRYQLQSTLVTAARLAGHPIIWAEPTGCATSCTFSSSSSKGSFNACAFDWQGIRDTSAS